MSSILNEIFENFNDLADKQNQLERVEFDKSQFDFIKTEAGLGNEHPTRYLQDSILITADDKDVLEEKKFPFGLEREDIVEVAHPETVVVADGPHTSGVVDNQNEQHQKIVDMVNKMPTGNVFHDLRLAEQVNELVSIANDLDSQGHTIEAIAIDDIALEIATLKKKLKINKEAFAFLAPLLTPLVLKGVAGGIAALGLTGVSIAAALGWEEDLPEDTADLVKNIESWKDDPEYQSQKNTIARLYQNAQFLNSSAKRIYSLLDNNGAQLTSELKTFGLTLDSVTKDVQKLNLLFSGWFGEDFELTKGRLRDIQSNYRDLLELGQDEGLELNNVTDLGHREPDLSELGGHSHHHAKEAPMPQSDSKRIEGIQEFLKQYVDSSIFVTGRMDAKTRSALDQFAETVSVYLGVGNLDGTRLEREGTNASLRKIYDIYKHPWKYTK